jgi:hypothetical protein
VESANNKASGRTRNRNLHMRKSCPKYTTIN